MLSPIKHRYICSSTGPNLHLEKHPAFWALWLILAKYLSGVNLGGKGVCHHSEWSLRSHLLLSPVTPCMNTTHAKEICPGISCLEVSVQGSYRKIFLKFTNFSQTFAISEYGTEKQHKGTQLFHTSGKGAQPLM